MFKVALFAPVVAGAKVIDTVQVLLPAVGARFAGQLVFGVPHCPGFVPPLVGALIARYAPLVLVFVIVTDFATLVVPISWFKNASEVGDTV